MWIAAQQLDDRLYVWVQEGDATSRLTMPTAPNIGTQQKVLEVIEPYLSDDKSTVVICSGIADAPPVYVPCSVSPAQRIDSADPRLSFFAMPRLAQVQPQDLMQGAEAVVAGFVAQCPEWDGVLCITGSATRWVHISAGEVVSFRSFLTGEIFGLLRAHSTLRYALVEEDWDADIYLSAVADSMSRPERFGAVLASARAQSILATTEAGALRAQISGSLIGAELAAARPYWLGQRIAVIGEGKIADCYDAALSGQGAMTERHSAHELAFAGLRDAYENLRRN